MYLSSSNSKIANKSQQQKWELYFQVFFSLPLFVFCSVFRKTGPTSTITITVATAYLKYIFLLSNQKDSYYDLLHHVKGNRVFFLIKAFLQLKGKGIRNTVKMKALLNTLCFKCFSPFSFFFCIFHKNIEQDFNGGFYVTNSPDLCSQILNLV